MKRSKDTNPDVLGLLVRQMDREGLPLAVREHRFHPVRRWRFDLAYPDLLLAFEYEGGIFTFGGHSRGKGFAKDVEKYNTAGLMGWRVFRIVGDMVYKHNREMDEGWKLVQDVLTSGPFSEQDKKIDCFKDNCCADCSRILIDHGLEQVSEEDEKLYKEIVESRKTKGEK